MLRATYARWFTLALAAALVAVATAALGLGSVAIPPGEALGRLWAALQGQPTDDVTTRILLASRVPRILLAGAVGAGLALAGLASQTLFRNPLASPYVVGVSGGSAVGAVAAMLLVGKAGGLTFAAVPVFSIAGGLGVAVCVFTLAQRGTHFGHSLLLAGIAVGALCSSLTAGALYLAGEKLQILVFWLMGGLWRTNWRDAMLMMPVTCAAFTGMMLLAPAMNVVLVGERSARDLGVRVATLQGALLIIIAVTTAVAVSLTGVIGFVGLIVPHLFRLCVGADHRRLVPAVAIGGALLLIVADTLARTVAAPAEVPVGILTAVVGAPIFLWLLQKKGIGKPST